MDLNPGDRLIDKRGEWEIIWRPHTSAAGKTVSVYVQLVGQPTVAEIRSWAAHERVSVKREEGK